MDTDTRKALESARGFLNWASTLDDMWQSQTLHVPGLNEQPLGEVMAAFEGAQRFPLVNPLGVVLQGAAGSGKTHMLGQVRQRVQEGRGYFFVVELLDASTFWESARAGIVSSLGRPGLDRDTQLAELLWELASLAHVSRADRRAIAGEDDLSPEQLDTFIAALAKVDRKTVRDCRNTLRALVLSGAAEFALQDIGDAYLNGSYDPGSDHETWGLKYEERTAQQTVRDISWIVALAGPAVLAVDQIDTLLAQSQQRTEVSDEPTDNRDLEHVAHGLMSIRENMRRTVGVVAVLPAAWESIRQRAVKSVADRFREASILEALPTPEVGRSILERRFAAGYADVGFTPPYSSWPIRPEAFAEAPDYTPRRLLKCADEHLRSCLLDGELTELDSLQAAGRRGGTGGSGGGSGDTAPGPLDARFAEYRRRAVTAAAVDPDGEDTTMPDLLGAALKAWIAERPGGESDFRVDPAPGAKPVVHARLRQSIDAATDDERHWTFRAIASGNALAVQSRIRNASDATGLASGSDRRQLFLLRNSPWPKGPKTKAILAEFAEAGGRALGISDDDLRTLIALRDLMVENPPELPGWLAARRPAHGIAMLREALGDEAGEQSEPVPEDVVEELVSDEESPTPPAVRELSPTAVPLGMDEAAGVQRGVDLLALRKHTAIFAGSGSGKTVLVRRIIEECALRGVSSIVLDVNNDLSRLGSAWPQTPVGWDPADTARSEEFLANTEVLVWTPNKMAGRPLAFQPLPDFSGIVDDADEFDEAVESAVAALEPRALITGGKAKVAHARAVLTEALRWYGRQPSTSLEGFIGVLADLPDEACTLPKARERAAEMAANLRAEMINDKMFGGAGATADPGVLLTPSDGYRARVSVISMVGLANEQQREGFVNQLQMALFSWIKRNPAGDRPLSGLLVMDEAQNFVPSGRSTISLRSTLALSSQARKYGLGLIYATQAPKGLHPFIPGNAATQFFGFLNSPVQIATAKEFARVKGGLVPDISRLRAGTFYAALEGEPFHKIKTPWCLSHHPASPPTTEEVLRLAQGDAGSA